MEEQRKPANICNIFPDENSFGSAWEQLCSILKKQLGISSCQVPPFGTPPNLETSAPLPSYPVHRCSLKTTIPTPQFFFTKETLEIPVTAARVPS